MKFVTLKSSQFSRFADKHPQKSFYQTPQIAKLRESKGWTTYYFGAKNDDKIVAAAYISAKPTFLGKSIYYCPGGPLIDYEDRELVNFFFKNLQKYAKSHNGYVIHIEPYYELTERDRDGKPIEGGFNHESAINNLKNLGFVSVPADSPQYSFVLNLKDQTPDKLFASFKQNTRNLISRTARKGIKVRELDKSELRILKRITESTAARREFTDKPLSYYEEMYDLFYNRSEVKFLIAELEPNNANEQPSTTSSPQSSKHIKPDTSVSSSESTSVNSTTIPLSTAMFMTYGSEVIYLFSGSDEKYMHEYNAQYAIQWHMVQYALEHKYTRYNFYGIQGLPDPSKPGYGIYKFKKGFSNSDTGRVTELIGAFELPVNLPFYRLHHILSRLRHRH